MEKISIQNFAGIQALDFEFKAINIFTGPQGSGKSVIMKLHYFFRGFGAVLKKNLNFKSSLADIEQDQVAIFTTVFPKHTWPQESFKITYTFDDIHISIERHEKKIRFLYDENLSSLVEKIKESEPSLLSKEHQLIKQAIGAAFIYDHYFLPAGRRFSENVRESLSDKNYKDPLLLAFDANYKLVQVYYRGDVVNHSQDPAVEALVHKVLNGSYLWDNKDRIMHKDGRKVEMSYVSAGQQEAYPLIVSLHLLNRMRIIQRGAIIYIEDPEANLCANAQKAIVQLLARTYNNPKGNKIQIFLTSQSQYILSAFNNLLEAGRLTELHPEKADRISQIVPAEEQLKSGLIAAYSINDGRKENLVDETTGLLLEDSANDIVAEAMKLQNI